MSVFFQSYSTHKDARMNLFYVCCSCQYKWTTEAQWCVILMNKWFARRTSFYSVVFSTKLSASTSPLSPQLYQSYFWWIWSSRSQLYIVSPMFSLVQLLDDTRLKSDRLLSDVSTSSSVVPVVKNSLKDESKNLPDWKFSLPCTL